MKSIELSVLTSKGCSEVPYASDENWAWRFVCYRGDISIWLGYLWDFSFRLVTKLIPWNLSGFRNDLIFTM